MKLLEVLLQNRANTTIGDNLDETPLHYLVQKPDFRDNIISEQLEAAELLIAYGASVDARNGYGETPLHTACKWHGKESLEASTNRLRFIPLLLKSGADANEESDTGFMPLHYLLSSGFTEDKAHAANCLLTYHGANPNKTTKAGFTCLHAAVAGCHLEWVTFLLAQPGIDMHVKHQPRLKRAQLMGGNTALDMAIEMVLCFTEIPPDIIKIVKDKQAPAGSPGMRHPMNNCEIISQDTKWAKASKQHTMNKIFVTLLAKLMGRPL
jgi:ankyrin repeat protein